MVKYNESFKTNTAKTFTELAIQNGLIPNYENPEDTAEAVCTFFKTIFEKLDSEKEEQSFFPAVIPK